MTLTGIKSTRKEVEEIRAMFPRPPELTPEQQARIDSLSDVEIIIIATGIIGERADPRTLRPSVDTTPRNCARCRFSQTGNAQYLQHFPCDFLEKGGFRP